MVQINFALKEVNCKVVYYGPGLSGKTTNLEVVHGKAPKSHCGELTSIATEGDRTLFFDFLPLNLGKVAGMNTKFQIYTVPGQVYYNSTRKLVLQGTDGIVFVADSRESKMDENLESLHNLEENLQEYGMDIHSIPLVIQYNKRDLDDILTVEELEERLNSYQAPYFEAVAVSGEGVFPTLKKLSSMVLENLNHNHGSARLKASPPAKVKEPVMAANAGSARVAAKPKQARKTKPPVNPQRKAALQGKQASPATGQARGGGSKIREKVSRSSGINAIERKLPPHGSGTKRRPRSRARQRVESPVSARKNNIEKILGGKKAPVLLIIFSLLAAAGVGIYLSGIWKQFI